MTIRRVTSLDEPTLVALAELHIACVDEGASMSFRKPLAREAALAYWRDIGTDVARGARALLVAEDAQGVCGTSQLVLAMPDNQPHRAELVKLMVDTRARGQKLAGRLLAASEELARSLGKTLLVLDTVTGSTAEGLYARHGWTRVGEIPHFAIGPDGALCPTTLYYRLLAPLAQP